ncbi:Spaetzle [Trinorchestia longiramus]|nr:Spaetzle [Trinorchestia longiramus]
MRRLFWTTLSWMMAAVLLLAFHLGAADPETQPALVSHHGSPFSLSPRVLPQPTTPLPPFGFSTPAFEFSNPAYVYSTPAFSHSTPMHHSLFGISTAAPFFKPKFIHEQKLLRIEKHPKNLHDHRYKLCTAEKSPQCAYNTSKPWCLQDHFYPLFDIEADFLFHRKAVLDLYADFADLNTASSVVRPLHLNDETYLCPSYTAYVRPLRALDIKGRWRTIVNGVKVDYKIHSRKPDHTDAHHEVLTQTLRLEECVHRGHPCPLVPHCHGTVCLQQFTYQRLLVYDPCDNRFPFGIESFKLPSACACQLGDHYIIH